MTRNAAALLLVSLIKLLSEEILWKHNTEYWNHMRKYKPVMSAMTKISTGGIGGTWMAYRLSAEQCQVPDTVVIITLLGDE